MSWLAAAASLSLPWLLCAAVFNLLGGRLAAELITRLFHHVEREVKQA